MFLLAMGNKTLEVAKDKQQNSTEALQWIIYTSLNCEIVFL